jgi:hypothetical protein
VIQDLDDTIKELLITKGLIDTAAVDIKFEVPTKEWAAGVSKPTINVFLYDIRENHELRSNERYLSRSGASGMETRAPARVDVTYFISVWTSDVSDEHRLLGGLLTSLLQHPVLPPEMLKGAMANQFFPLHAWIAQPDRTPNVWEFWQGLDGRLKAGISYVVTLAVSPFAGEEVGLVTEKVLKLKAGG